MSEDKLKRTPLYETHIKYGGRMVPFAGWEIPIQYAKGVIAEHMAIRTGCGMFDVSHMGETLVLALQFVLLSVSDYPHYTI